MRKLSVIVAAAAVTLTGCAVSDEERAACESQGGEVVHERFKTGREGFWDRDETNAMNFCKVNGRITAVYHEEVLPQEEDGRKRDWATSCQAESGHLYLVKHTRRVGKVTTTRRDYICVADGKVVAAHLHGDSK